MKVVFCLIVWLFTGALFAQNTWVKRDSVNGPPRGACSNFTLDGEAYVLTGVAVDEFKRKMYSYDLEQDDWDEEEALGGESGDGLERASAVGFSGGGYGFLALGQGSASPLKDTWRYDPISKTWTQMADFEGTGRAGAIAFVVDDIAYVGTGQDLSGLQNDFYSYQISSNTWSSLSDFPGEARKEAVGFTMGGKGYVGTGRGEFGYFTDFWEYDPSTDSWSEKAEFPGSPRMGAVGCGTFPSAFIMLGEDNTFAYKQDVWEYNYFGDIWTQRADYMGGTRTQANAMVVADRIFVGLGYNGIYHDDFYEYQRLPASLNSETAIDFTLFPNPVTEMITIQFSDPITDPRITLVGINGQNYSDHFTIDLQNNNSLVLSISEKVSTGIYFLNLYDGETYLCSQKISVR